MPSRSVPAPPRKGLKRFTARIVDIRRPSESLALTRLQFEPGTEYPFEPGQWCYVFAPGPEGELRNPYSIASSPNNHRQLDLCVKKVATAGVADWVYHRDVGDQVEVSASLGTFRFRSPAGRTVVFLATGTGVAPLRSMIHHLWMAKDPRPVWLFLGSGHKQGLPYHEEWEHRAQAHPEFHYVPTLSRAGTWEWTGQRGWIQEHFTRRFRGRHDFDAYVCGVKEMVDDVSTLLRGMGLGDNQVHREKYT